MCQQFSLCPPPPGPGGTGLSNFLGIASGGAGSTPSHCPGTAIMRIAANVQRSDGTERYAVVKCNGVLIIHQGFAPETPPDRVSLDRTHHPHIYRNGRSDNAGWSLARQPAEPHLQRLSVGPLHPFDKLE